MKMTFLDYLAQSILLIALLSWFVTNMYVLYTALHGVLITEGMVVFQFTVLFAGFIFAIFWSLNRLIKEIK